MSTIPSVSYEYPKPFNFDPSDPQFDIFKNLPPENCSAPEIKFLKNVRISNNSVVFYYFKIFRESCIAREIYEKYQSGYRFFLKFIFPQFNFSKKRFLLITDEWTSNYYHWHIFALTKLAVLQNNNLIENSLLLLPKKYQRYSCVQNSVEKFGIKKNQIVYLRRKSNIRVAELPLIKACQNHPIIFRKIRETLLKNIKNFESDFGDKIYISRENQSARYVENEKEFMALIEKYGFKKIIADKLTYEEQVSILSKTKYLLSPHGAGLTNILFMPENGYVLEMATGFHPEKPLTDYYKLAAMLNLNYLYQQCEMGESTKIKTSDPHEGSVLVDLEKLEKNLKQMFNNV